MTARPEARLRKALGSMAVAFLLVLGLGAWVLHQDHTHVEHEAMDEAGRQLARVMPEVRRLLDAEFTNWASQPTGWSIMTQGRIPLADREAGLVIEMGPGGEVLRPALLTSPLRIPAWWTKLGSEQRTQAFRMEGGGLKPEEWKALMESVRDNSGLRLWCEYQHWMQTGGLNPEAIREGLRLCQAGDELSPAGVPIRELILWRMAGLGPLGTEVFFEVNNEMQRGLRGRSSWMMPETIDRFRIQARSGSDAELWLNSVARWEDAFRKLTELHPISAALGEELRRRVLAGWVMDLPEGMMAWRLLNEGVGEEASRWWLVSRAHWVKVVQNVLVKAGAALPGFMRMRVEALDLGVSWPQRGMDPALDEGKVLAREAFVIEGRFAPIRFELALRLVDTELLYAGYRTRLGWMLVMLVVSLGFVGFAVWTVVQAFREQARLQEEQQNFVASVSHELRAPLAAVSLMTENLAGDKVETGVRRADYLQRMLRECRRLSGMVENVLDFSRIQRGRQTYEKEPTDVGGVLEHTVSLMRENAVRQEVRLELESALAPGFQAYWDGRAVHQALINLIDNAIKHSPLGGLVRVTASNNHEGHVWIQVIDEGPGIPESERERIFDRFYRLGSELRRETPGIGIGLSLVRHVAHAHGGSVWVNPSGLRGSCFILDLPVGMGLGKGGAV